MRSWTPPTLFAFALCLASLVASASPITYTFTGIVNSTFQNAGRTVSGWLTVDYATFNDTCTVPTAEIACPMGIYGPAAGTAYTSPLQVSGFASDGLFTTTIGGGRYRDVGMVLIERNFGGNANQFTVIAQSDATSLGPASVIALETNDYVGTQSKMFINPNAGLDVNQPVDFFASTRLFSIIDLSDGRGGHETATLTSLEITRSVEIPEPNSLALAGFGLATILISRRRHPMPAEGNGPSSSPNQTIAGNLQ